jgi:hypothetical protein
MTPVPDVHVDPDRPPTAVMARRFAAQLLSGEPARTPEDVAGRLLAVQGQDPRGARLAIRARSSGLTATDVDAALTRDRTLLITWLNRGTLHLIRSEDYWLLHRLMVRPQHEVQCRRIIARSGVTPDEADEAVGVITRALADGPLTRPQLGERLVATGIPGTGGAVLHLLILACQRGLAVRGPMIGAQHAYVLVRDWLGAAPPARDLEADLAELARRYLAGHGPASDRDLAKWAGLPLGQVRRGLSTIAPLLRERGDGLAELASAPAEPGGLPAPRLLGSYDPVLLGWASRQPILGPHQQIVTVNGLFRPFALVAGRAAGTWSWTTGQVVLERLTAVAEEDKLALAAEARDIRRFLRGEPEAG